MMRTMATAALFLLGAAIFAAVYCQAPLYYSNQNQYFLHGLAQAGAGLLHEDWLANTGDPTPAFTALVAVTGRWLHPWFFYVYHALLLGIYAGSMLAIFAWLAGPELAARRWPIFLALLVAVHSAAARWLSYRLVGQDYPWFLQAGVAGQYILGAMLQPSTFGVLLVASIVLFLQRRPLLAAACAALAANIHATYLLPAGLLTAGYMTSLCLEGQVRRAVALGALALVLVLPMTLYVVIRFGPTSPETFAEAQDILVNLRIPHHARPDLWFDLVAALQIAWVALALALVAKTRLFPVLAVPVALSALLTLLQVGTHSNSLALLFPWRISAVLVPIATTIALGRLVALRSLPLDGRPCAVAALLAIALLAGAGIWIGAARLAFASGDEELPVMDFVRDSRKPGDVYLLPVTVPNLVATTHGSLSSDFKPLAAKKADGRIIPLGLQRFRLYTGVPIYVDFKSIPYKDVDVIEWQRRLRLAESLQRSDTRPVDELRLHGITHVIEPASAKRLGLKLLYEDAVYRVYGVD